MARRGRSREFRELFNLPEDETLVDDYSCALARTILLQGRMYVSRNYICFFARVLIPFASVVAIEKKYTALVVPNAIEVTARMDDESNQVKSYFFTSFMNRDATFTLLEKMWELRRERDAVITDHVDPSTPVNQEQELSLYGKTLPATFALPSSEVILQQFPCVNRSLLHGQLYVTHNYICFDTSMFPGRANRVVIRMKDVKSVKKAQFAKFMPGTGHSLQITTKDGKSHSFSGLTQRDIAHAVIAQAATPFGVDVSDDRAEDIGHEEPTVFSEGDISDGEDAVDQSGLDTSTINSIDETPSAPRTSTEVTTPPVSARSARKRSSSEPLIVTETPTPPGSRMQSVPMNASVVTGHGSAPNTPPKASAITEQKRTATTSTPPKVSEEVPINKADAPSSLPGTPQQPVVVSQPTGPASSMPANSAVPAQPVQMFPSVDNALHPDVEAVAVVSAPVSAESSPRAPAAVKPAVASVEAQAPAAPEVSEPAVSLTLPTFKRPVVPSLALKSPTAAGRFAKGLRTRESMASLDSEYIHGDVLVITLCSKVCHRVGTYTFFLPRQYEKKRLPETAGVIQRQYVFSESGAWVRLAVNSVTPVGSGVPVRYVAEVAAREIASRELTKNGSRSHRSHILSVETLLRILHTGSAGKYGCGPSTVLLLMGTVLPPHASLQQDIILTIRGAGGVYPHDFAHHLHSTADTISPAEIAAYDRSALVESVNKLSASDDVLVFAHRDLKISPECIALCRVFASRVQTLMEREALKLRGVDESVAQKMPIEDPFEVVEELDQLSLVDSTISPDEWRSRVSRYLAVFTQSMSGFRFKNLVDLPSLASCPDDTRQIVLRLLDYFVHLRAQDCMYTDRPLVSKVDESEFLEVSIMNERVLIDLLDMQHLRRITEDSPYAVPQLMWCGPAARTAAARETARTASTSVQHRQAFFEAGMVAELLGLLQARDDPYGWRTEYVAKSLANITTEIEAAKKQFMEQSGPEKLLPFLASNCDEVGYFAAALLMLKIALACCVTLKNCMNTQNHREQMAEQGVIAGLVQVLQGSLSAIPGARVNEELVCAAVAALWNAAACEGNRTRIATDGGLPVIATLLKMDLSDQVLEKLAGAVLAICSNNDENKAWLGRAGIIEPLCAVVNRKPSSDMLFTLAAAALAVLSTHKPNAEVLRKLCTSDIAEAAAQRAGSGITAAQRAVGAQLRELAQRLAAVLAAT